MQSLRNTMFLDEVTRSRRAYNHELLIESVILSGMLRNCTDTTEVVLRAAEIIIPEPRIRQHFTTLVKQHGIPAPSTLLRHRLTMHMTFCLELSRIVVEMLCTGMVASWRTLDLSPKGGYEWLMHGVSMIAEVTSFCAYPSRANYVRPNRKRIVRLASETYTPRQRVRRIICLLSFVNSR